MNRINKIFKKIVLFSVTLFLLFGLLSNYSYADTYYNNSINVTVKKDGSAVIESMLDIDITKGTEYYIPIDNLGKSEIIDYKVYKIVDGQKIPFKFKENWNIKDSREEKTGKYGIIKTSKGYELAFGFGEYGRANFIMEYTVSNFAKILNDSDMIFWKFVNDNLDAGPQKVKINIIKEDGSFDNNNSKIWGFGTKGEINFKNNEIEFNSLQSIGKRNYVTLLVKIDKGYFTSGEKIDKDFSYYQDKAFENSQYKKTKKKRNIVEKLLYIFSRYFHIITIFIIVFFGTKKMGTKIKGGYKKGNFKDEYYRTIPEKDWWKLSLVLESAGFESQKSIFQAFFLKWIQDKLLIPITEEGGRIFKKEKPALKINFKEYNFSTDIEKKLFQMVVQASKDDKILQEKEFSKYLSSKTNQSKYKEIIYQLKSTSMEYLVSNDYLVKSNSGRTKKVYNESGKKFTENLVKYYNYLKDFTLLDEREIKEITVWKELLIYASLFDVAKTVEKQLKKLSPEVLIENDIDLESYNRAIFYSYMFSNSFVDAYTTSVQRSSSGSGGFTSIGGGGGSFGGSSGGGSR